MLELSKWSIVPVLVIGRLPISRITRSRPLKPFSSTARVNQRNRHISLAYQAGTSQRTSGGGGGGVWSFGPVVDTQRRRRVEGISYIHLFQLDSRGEKSIEVGFFCRCRVLIVVVVGRTLSRYLSLIVLNSKQQQTAIEFLVRLRSDEASCAIRIRPLSPTAAS